MLFGKKAPSNPRWKNRGATRRGTPFFALRRWRRFCLILFLALAGLGGAALVSYPYLQGWSRPPEEAKLAAKLAVEQARGVDAQRWAPLSIDAAERAMRSAFWEESRQRARLLVRRDYRLALQGFVEAERLAREAYDGALGKMALSKSEALEALKIAEGDLDHAERIALVMPLTSGERRLLNKARIHLLESRDLYDKSEYEHSARSSKLSSGEARLVFQQAFPRTSRYTGEGQVSTWRRWINETIAWSKANKKTAVIVYKEKNLVALYDKGKLARTFKGDMGRNTAHAKLSAGDWATPEGRYRITAKKGRRQSKYYKALLLNYPNDEDRKRFQTAIRDGLIPKGSKLGALIEIHGEGGRDEDWTRGCVALSNEDMDRVYASVEVGTPVTIVGGDGQNGTFSDFYRYYRDRGGPGAP